MKMRILGEKNGENDSEKNLTEREEENEYNLKWKMEEGSQKYLDGDGVGDDVGDDVDVGVGVGVWGDLNAIAQISVFFHHSILQSFHHTAKW